MADWLNFPVMPALRDWQNVQKESENSDDGDAKTDIVVGDGKVVHQTKQQKPVHAPATNTSLSLPRASTTILPLQPSSSSSSSSFNAAAAASKQEEAHRMRRHRLREEEEEQHIRHRRRTREKEEEEAAKIRRRRELQELTPTTTIEPTTTAATETATLPPPPPPKSTTNTFPKQLMISASLIGIILLVYLCICGYTRIIAPMVRNNVLNNVENSSRVNLSDVSNLQYVVKLYKKEVHSDDKSVTEDKEQSFISNLLSRVTTTNTKKPHNRKEQEEYEEDDDFYVVHDRTPKRNNRARPTQTTLGGLGLQTSESSLWNSVSQS